MHALIKGTDAGGTRWALENRAVHAGRELELALQTKTEWCTRCDGEGTDYNAEKVPDPHTPGWFVHPTCARCEGAGELPADITWVPVRFETEGEVAVGYLRTVGGDSARFVITARMRWRWAVGERADRPDLRPEWRAA